VNEPDAPRPVTAFAIRSRAAGFEVRWKSSPSPTVQSYAILYTKESDEGHFEGVHSVLASETGAIVEYLVETYGKEKLAPKPGTAERRAWTYWLHYAEGSAMPPFLLKLVMLHLPARTPGLIRPIIQLVSSKAVSGFIDPMISTHLVFWESSLAASPWFAGKAFSAADVMMSFPVEVAATRADLGQYPKIAAFLAAIHARPAYQRALERGGPYQIMG